MKRILSMICLAAVSGVSFSQSIEDVGEVDSFGRDAIHLGSARTVFMYMKSDCTDDLARGQKCAVIQPAPAETTFDHADLASIRLPGRVANSTLCFELTPLIDLAYANTTGSTVSDALFSGRATLTIKSAVLVDPNIINPQTRQPFNGQFLIPTVQYSERQTLAPDESNRKSLHFTRRCAGAAVTRQMLRGWGFSAFQASSFFNNPVTVTLSAAAVGRYVTDVGYQVNLRLYGDRR
jgi:hypothetical protein